VALLRHQPESQMIVIQISLTADKMKAQILFTFHLFSKLFQAPPALLTLAQIPEVKQSKAAVIGQAAETVFKLPHL
jgi:hypothetical protein